jgi:hypothetical protein
MVHDLQSIAIDIYRFCLNNSILIYIEWIPRSENEKADYLSKICDFDDWGISNEMLNAVQRKLGNLDVDWFASDDNAKLPVFYSRFQNVNSSCVVAFTEDWSWMFGLFVPPISIVSEVLKKMYTDNVQGVLIIPHWVSARFWPILCLNGKFIKNVVDWILLPTEKEFYTCCKNGKGIFGNQNLHFNMLAIKISFK